MTEFTPKQNVVILGMHRSGTSALAGALCQMGWDCGPPNNLLAPDWANEKGYFERKDVVEANERLLIDATNSSGLSALITDNGYAPLESSAWALGALALSRISYQPSQLVSEAIKAASQNLIRHTPPNRPWMLKDPRLCLTLPFWAKHIEIGRLILIVRNPREVALSLNRLYGFPLEINKLAWAAYVAAMLKHRHIAPSILVLHSELIGRPSETMSRISAHVADSPGNTTNQAGATFIDSALVHHAVPSGLADTPYEQAYLSIAKDDLEGAEACLQAITANASMSNWRVVRLLFQILKLESDINAMHGRFERINQHPVTGPILRLARWIKGDPTFGADEG